MSFPSAELRALHANWATCCTFYLGCAFISDEMSLYGPRQFQTLQAALQFMGASCLSIAVCCLQHRGGWKVI